MSKIKYLSNGTIRTVFFSLDRPNNDYYLPLSINGKLEYAFTCTASSPLVSDLRLFNGGTKKYILAPPSSFYSTAATFSTAITRISSPLYNSSSKYFIGSYYSSQVVTPVIRKYFNSSDYGVTWNICKSYISDSVLRTDNNYFYLIEPNSSNLILYRSTSGTAWATVGSAISAGYISGDFGSSVYFHVENNKLFVITSNTTLTTNSIIYSSPIDTPSWSTANSPYIDSSFTPAYIVGNSQNKLLMYLYKNDNQVIMLSEDNGATWINLLTPSQINSNVPSTTRPIYGNKRFLAYYIDSGLTRTYIINESDLSNFTTSSILKSNQTFANLALRYHNGMFYGFSVSSTISSVYRSANGLDWDFVQSVSVGETLNNSSLGCGFEGGVLLGVANSNVFKTVIR